MRRIKSDYETLKMRMKNLQGMADKLAASLEKAKLDKAAGKIGLAARRLENICTFCVNLGSTVPGLDESRIDKIMAEWRVCHRLAKNTTGVGALGPEFQALLTSMKQVNEFLNKNN